MRRVRHGVAVLVVTVLAAAGCGGDDTSRQASSPPASPPPVADSPAGPGAGEATSTPVPVPETLDFQVATVDGGQLDGSTLAGQPVAFWFWAAWCPRCAAFASDLKDIQAEYADQVHVVGVAGLNSGEQSMRDFVARHELEDFPHLADDDGEVWLRFGVTTQEYVVILDASGEIVHQGALNAQGLRSQLASVAG